MRFGLLPLCAAGVPAELLDVLGMDVPLSLVPVVPAVELDDTATACR
ncbi:hypothetical protein ABH935_002676 [Catenulispora sp. GAS73]